jgi:hypothetical protein
MKSVLYGMVACVFVASTAAAQTPGAPATTVGAQKIPLNEGLRRSYNSLKMNLTETAAKLTDADYSYRPSPDIRVFGAQLAHIANSQFNACAAARGEANPTQGKSVEQTATTKADIVKALADSFAFCDPAFASLTDQTAVEFVRQGMNDVARGSVLANLLVHGNLEYGVLTVYLRTKGMVPPSTERGMRGRGAAAPTTPPAAPPARGQ